MGLLKQQRIDHQTIFVTAVFALLLSISFGSVLASATNKLEREWVPGQLPESTSIKCGGCPCVNPCGQLPPPPPPTPPPPPPPATTYCPPQVVQTPPPPRFIYVTGEPGEIYHTTADGWGFYNTAERNVATNLKLLWAACGLLGLFVFTW